MKLWFKLCSVACATVALWLSPMPSAQASGAFGKTVYLITMDRMDQHWVKLNEGAVIMAAALGLRLKWAAPEVKDNAKQIDAINNAVADKASLILLAANDPKAVSEAVKNAQSKGVKIIYVDSSADVPAVATLSTDNFAAGELAGRTMIAELKAAGKTGGTVGIVGVNTATKSTMERENGFRSVVKAAGYTIPNTEYKDGDAAASQEAATTFIAGNRNLVGLYGTNEGSTIGVGNAIRASGKPFIGIGFDKSDAILGLIKNGALKASMAQNPYAMGYLGVAQAFIALNEIRNVPATIDTGVSVLRP